LTFVDASVLEDGTLVRSDICVVGAGAAGITLALALGGAGRDVALLESGGLEREPETEKLQEARNLDPRYPLARSRLRYLGGATNHWGGLCRQLDPDDFVAHSWMEASGWPLGRQDLEPYYEKARPILDLPRARPPSDLEGEASTYPPLLGLRNAAFTPFLWLKSQPTRIGIKYRDELAQHARVRCLLHATAVELVANREATLVTGIEARTLAGRRLRFTARHYVLAAGGIENARLLLLSDSVVPAGLGNRYGLVGRYFMDHLNQVVGTMAVMSPPPAAAFREEQLARRQVPGVLPGLIAFTTTPRLRAEHRLFACALNATRDLRQAPEAAAVEELLADPMGTTPPETRPAVRRYWLTATAEQSPNAASRVFLSDERDALGSRKLTVDLRLTEDDVRSVRETLRLFGLDLARAGHGRVQTREVGEAGWYMLGGHHMGTTRMADDPRRGVTDRDGTVHGVANLHVAGSSLFPTSGFANPTLTIIALALRQADRLKVASEPRGGR